MPDRSELFTDIDSMEPDHCAAHLADDVTSRFGNANPVHGRAAVRDVWAQFCDSVDGVRHDPVERWESERGTVDTAGPGRPATRDLARVRLS